MKFFFGSLIRRYREATGMGVREFARDRGVDKGLLSGFETGSRPLRISPERVETLAEQIGVPDEERQLFRDASRLSRGKLPPDIADQKGAEEFILPAIERARKARGE